MVWEGIHHAKEKIASLLCLHVLCFGVDKGVNRTENSDYKFTIFCYCLLRLGFSCTFRFIAKDAVISVYIYL